jgi:hypothetical protein
MVAIVGEVEARDVGGKRLKSRLSIGYRVLAQVPIRVTIGTSSPEIYLDREGTGRFLRMRSNLPVK